MNNHGNKTLTYSGVGPQVTQLFNDRVRIVVRCGLGDNSTGWYYENRENIFSDYGRLMDATFAKYSEDEKTTQLGAWPDARLIRQELVGEEVTEILLTYETLTDSYVEEIPEVIDYELNGLRRVTRQLVAIDGTSYGKVVGTDTISHTALGYGTETLTLAAVNEIPEPLGEAGSTRLQEVWVQQGILSQSSSNEGEGVYVNSTTYLVSEDTQTAPVRSRSINNFEGLRTISVQTLTDADGNPINDGGSNLVHSFDREVDFEYPGEVSIGETSTSFSNVSGETTANFLDWYYDLTKGPVVKPITATYYVFYQDSNQIVASDFTYDGAIGRWAPDQWAKGEINGFSATVDEAFASYTSFRPNSSSQTINKYTAVAPLTKSGVGFSDGSPPTLRSVEGQFIFANNTTTISVSGGPGVPDGNKYVLNVDLREAFTDADGNVIWKKTIVVADIPTRS